MTFAKVNPGSFRRTGDISLEMLLEFFKPIDIIHQPKTCPRRFKWFAAVTGRDVPEEEYPEGMVVLCHADIAHAILKNNPSCFCLASAKEEDDLSWVGLGNNKARVVAFRERRKFYFYAHLLQDIFVNNMVWESEMDHIVYERGKLDDLLSVSEGVLGSFICITDTGYNLIACSQGREPVCGVFKYLVQNQCLPKEEMAFYEKEILPLSRESNRQVLWSEDDGHECAVLHYPVYIDGSYLFHVAMECNSFSVGAARFLFGKLMKRVVSLCSDFWRSTVNLESPWHRVLIGLLKGDRMTQEYLDAQLAMTAIPQSKQYRVLKFCFPSSMGNQQRERLLEASKNINDGLCYPFVYEDGLVVLCFTQSSGEAALSGKKIDHDVRTHVFDTFGIPSGSSQVFDDISEIPLAYRQASLAFKYRDLYKKEMCLVKGDEGIPSYPFEHILKYYMLTEGCDQELVKYSFNRSILRRLVQEDTETGTGIARLLMVYLSCDRNATETAKRIHVHRNTVLYHIDRIEKRFELDLESPILKNRVLLDYYQLMVEGVV